MGRIALYCDNVFPTDDSSANATQLAALQGSGFNTLIFWSLNVHTDGTLYYAGQPLIENGALASSFAYLQPLFASLRSNQSDGSPSTVTTILFSIGVGAPPPPQSWNNITALLATDSGQQTLTENFLALSAALGLDGFDYDMEYTYNFDTVVQFTELVCTPNPRMITFAPYINYTDWADTLPKIYTWDQGQTPVPFGQSVQWFNLQVYGNASGTGQFQPAVSGVASTSGISDATTFVVPGLSVGSPSYLYSPQDIQNQFHDQAYEYQVDGGFLWNSSLIFGSTSYTAQQYAQAIIDGLSSGSAEGAKATGALKKLKEAGRSKRGPIRVDPPPAGTAE